VQENFQPAISDVKLNVQSYQNNHGEVTILLVIKRL